MPAPQTSNRSKWRTTVSLFITRIGYKVSVYVANNATYNSNTDIDTMVRASQHSRIRSNWLPNTRIIPFFCVYMRDPT
jgi:hypothetical protein